MNFIKKYIKLINVCLSKQCFYVCQRLFNNSSKLKNEYVDWLMNMNRNNKHSFIPFNDNKPFVNNNLPRLITFYLPQFYETEINNKNFGKGFMEWYNVTKAIPQYTGQHQPQLPIDVGFYNLSHDDIMYRQIELAKNYGINGFCFYYYWFSGDRLLEMPLDNFLKNKELDMPFCLFWANENWTRIWGEGKQNEIIKKQEIRDDDAEKFVKDIVKYFKDSRYIKVNNKPLLIIYNLTKFPKDVMQDFISKIKIIIKNEGFDDIYIMTTDISNDDINLNEFNIDSMVEFTHRNIRHDAPFFDFRGKYVNPVFQGKVLDIKGAIHKGVHLTGKTEKTHRCVCAGWDNTPRKASKAMVFEMSPEDYYNWLKDSVQWTQENWEKDEQIVFIDSWNEWAEGAHLEPDQKNGYAYLQKTYEVIENVGESI